MPWFCTFPQRKAIRVIRRPLFLTIPATAQPLRGTQLAFGACVSLRFPFSRLIGTPFLKHESPTHPSLRRYKNTWQYLRSAPPPQLLTTRPCQPSPLGLLAFVLLGIFLGHYTKPPTCSPLSQVQTQLNSLHRSITPLLGPDPHQSPPFFSCQVRQKLNRPPYMYNTDCFLWLVPDSRIRPHSLRRTLVLRAFCVFPVSSCTYDCSSVGLFVNGYA